MECDSIVLERVDHDLASAVYSPDGLWIALVSFYGDIIVRESGSVQMMNTLRADTPVRSVVFSADSRRLLSGSEDNSARVWDIARGECLSELQHPAWAFAVAWSPDDTLFLTGCDDLKIRVWDARSYKLICILDGHMDYICCFTISPESAFFVSGGEEGIAIVWQLRPDDVPQEVRRLEGHTGYIRDVAISPDNSSIATASVDTVKMWSVAGNELWSVEVGEEPRSVTFSPGGRFLGVGIIIEDEAVGPDGVQRLLPCPVLILDACTGLEVARLEEHTKPVLAVSYHPHGHTVLSSSEDDTCRKWNLPEFLFDPPSL